jgi:hypothetical protein
LRQLEEAPKSALVGPYSDDDVTIQAGDMYDGYKCVELESMSLVVFSNPTHLILRLAQKILKWLGATFECVGKLVYVLPLHT